MGGHVTCIEERRVAYRVLVDRPEGRRPLGRPGPKWEEKILKWFFKNWNEKAWTGLIWLRIRTGVGHLWIR
jgi:hypothetical protein